MIQYARSDTHYLLYIYDCMRAQLLDFNYGQPGLLQSVWNRSRDISLKVTTSNSPYTIRLYSFKCHMKHLLFKLFWFFCFTVLYLPPIHSEIYEAHIHRRVLSGAAEEAEEVFQHPAAHCLQAALCLEGQAGQTGG